MHEYILRVADELVPVDEEIYDTYYKMKRRDKYLEESDLAHGTVSYDALDTEEYLGVDIICHTVESTEELVINKMLREELRDALTRLEPEEQRLMHELFFNEKSEREFARELGVYQNAVHKKKRRILEKLKKYLNK